MQSDKAAGYAVGRRTAGIAEARKEVGRRLAASGGIAKSPKMLDNRRISPRALAKTPSAALCPLAIADVRSHPAEMLLLFRLNPLGRSRPGTVSTRTRPRQSRLATPARGRRSRQEPATPRHGRPSLLSGGSGG